MIYMMNTSPREKVCISIMDLPGLGDIHNSEQIQQYSNKF